MRIFVTGASGFIGRTVTRTLVEHGHDVTALLLPGEPKNTVQGTAIVRGDVTRPFTLKDKMKTHDAVIHLAGAVGYQKWKTCIEVNINGTRDVVLEAIRCGVSRFIHMSSISVYGRVPHVPIGEDFPLKKIGDPYGDTKIDAENVVRKFARKGKLDLTIVRPNAVYGIGDEKFLPTLVRNLERGGFRMIGDGTQTVELVHVEDVARFIVMVLADKNTYGQVYNIANPANPSWNELLKLLSSELNIPVSEKHLSFRTAYLLGCIMELVSKISKKPPRLTRYSVRLVGQHYNYLADKARVELGYTPQIELLEGVREAVRSLQTSAPASF